MIPSVYRVVAVVVAAFVTTAVIAVVTPMPWWLAAAGALVLWVGLAVLQEHDERVVLPVDSVFEAHLRELVDPVLQKREFEYGQAIGVPRAHGGLDSFLYVGPGDQDLWILRDPRQGTMGFSAPLSVGKDADVQILPAELLERARRVVDPESDAVFVAGVLKMWVEDPSLHLPPPPHSSAPLRRRRGSGWFSYGPR